MDWSKDACKCHPPWFETKSEIWMKTMIMKAAQNHGWLRAECLFQSRKMFLCSHFSQFHGLQGLCNHGYICYFLARVFAWMPIVLEILSSGWQSLHHSRVEREWFCEMNCRGEWYLSINVASLEERWELHSANAWRKRLQLVPCQWQTNSFVW